MPDQRIAQVAAILEEAERLHGEVSRRTNGADPEWPLFYAWYLAAWSDLPQALATTPTRSQLIFELVSLDREYRAEPRQEPWSVFYAERLLGRAWEPAGQAR